MWVYCLFFLHLKLHYCERKKSKKKAFEEFGIYFFELPKFQKTSYTQNETHTLLESWTAFLSKQNKENLEKIAMQEQSIQQAYKKLQYLSSDKKMQYLYHIESMKEIGLKTNLRAAKEKGIAEGIEKGRLEEKRTTAQHLKSLGVPTEMILQATGFSMEEIEKI